MDLPTPRNEERKAGPTRAQIARCCADRALNIGGGSNNLMLHPNLLSKRKKKKTAAF